MNKKTKENKISLKYDFDDIEAYETDFFNILNDIFENGYEKQPEVMKLLVLLTYFIKDLHDAKMEFIYGKNNKGE